MAPSRSGRPGIGGFEETTRVPAGSLTESKSSPDQITRGAERESSLITQPSSGTSARRPTALGRGSPKMLGSPKLLGSAGTCRSGMVMISPVDDGPAPGLRYPPEPRIGIDCERLAHFFEHRQIRQAVRVRSSRGWRGAVEAADAPNRGSLLPLGKQRRHHIAA